MTVSAIKLQAPVLTENLSVTSNETLNRIKKLNSNYFSWNDQVLSNQLKTMTPIELNNVLRTYFQQVLESSKNPIDHLDRIASLLPLEKLEDPKEALKKAKGMIEEAKAYLNTTEIKPAQHFILNWLNTLYEALIAAIEGIISTFGILSFFETPESDAHAEMKSQKIFKLLSLFTILSASILPALGAAVGAKAIGITILSISALSIVWPYIKPMTTRLPAKAENWTKEIREGCFIPRGRKQVHNKMANILKSGRHIKMRAPSRMGKTVTVKSFADAVERGEYPELKGCVFFYFNSKNIVDRVPSYLGGTNDSLDTISKGMGRHKDKIILVFDEVHMFCKESKMADALKTFLDKGGKFKYVIGITTFLEDEEYVKKDPALNNRFEDVDIESADDNETQYALANMVLQDPSKPLIAPEALSYIYARSLQKKGDSTQPYDAIKLMEKCITKVSRTQKSPTEDKIIDLTSRIRSFRTQAAAARGKVDYSTTIAGLKQQRKALKDIRKQEKVEVEKLYKVKDNVDLIVKKMYERVLKVAGIASEKLSVKKEKELKKILLLKNVLQAVYEGHLKKKAAELGIKVEIDKALVDEVAPPAPKVVVEAKPRQTRCDQFLTLFRRCRGS